MAYKNARDIFPESLLRRIQRYVSGEVIYIPRGSNPKTRNEPTDFQRYIESRNADIRSDFSCGMSPDKLAEKYSLSYDSIKRIVYCRKEYPMLKYSATLSSASAYAKAEKLDAWIHLYLNEEGRNIPFSDGLKLFDRYYIAPALFPANLFHRCTGPEPGMKYPVDADRFEKHVADLTEAIRKDSDMPPLIAHYVDGDFELNDGNHRYKAYEDLGIDKIWVIIWITEENEYREFLEKYGVYVEECTVIRR